MCYVKRQIKQWQNMVLDVVFSILFEAACAFVKNIDHQFTFNLCSIDFNGQDFMMDDVLEVLNIPTQQWTNGLRTLCGHANMAFS